MGNNVWGRELDWSGSGLINLGYPLTNEVHVNTNCTKKALFPPHNKHIPSQSKKTNQSVLFGEMIAVHCDSHKQYISTTCGQKRVKLKQIVHVVTTVFNRCNVSFLTINTLRHFVLNSIRFCKPPPPHLTISPVVQEYQPPGRDF